MSYLELLERLAQSGAKLPGVNVLKRVLRDASLSPTSPYGQILALAKESIAAARRIRNANEVELVLDSDDE